ncbi:MAG: helix-turn-helix domain-containing protein [Deltaproteobacteria bacterium]|nr:MAG: helix-turn-helix domain-containing protein [Deltaproteobacteria bacterium]
MFSKGQKCIENKVGELVDNIIENENQSGVWSEVGRLLIKRALEKTEGNQVKAAKLLGISRNTLRNRIEKYGFLRKVKIASKG